MGAPTYVGEGDLLIPTPFGTALQPSWLLVYRDGYRYWFLRSAWIDNWRAVDARPGAMYWPTKGPKGDCKSVK